jgi:hypothetical protein
MVKTESAKSPLKNTRVVIQPVIRKGSSWLEDIHPQHSGAFLFEGSRIRLQGIPYDVFNQKYVDPLTPEEKEFFYKSDLMIEEGTLSIHAKNCFWHDFVFDLTREPIVLDLSDPMDYLKYKYVLSYKDLVASSWEERFNKGTYKFAVRNRDQEAVEKIDKINRQIAVMQKFIEIKAYPSKLASVLMLYYFKNGVTRNLNNVSPNHILVELSELIDKHPDEFYEIFTDKYFSTKLLIYQGILKGAIHKKGHTYTSNLFEGNMKLNDLIDFLEDIHNEDVKTKLMKIVEKV